MMSDRCLYHDYALFLSLYDCSLIINGLFFSLLLPVVVDIFGLVLFAS